MNTRGDIPPISQLQQVSQNVAATIAIHLILIWSQLVESIGDCRNKANWTDLDVQANRSMRQLKGKEFIYGCIDSSDISSL